MILAAMALGTFLQSPEHLVTPDSPPGSKAPMMVGLGHSLGAQAHGKVREGGVATVVLGTNSCFTIGAA